MPDGCRLRGVNDDTKNIEIARFIMGETIHVYVAVGLPYTVFVFTAAKRRKAREVQKEKNRQKQNPASEDVASSGKEDLSYCTASEYQ